MLTKYDFSNYSKLLDFKDQEDKAQFEALIDAGKLVAKTSLQDIEDAADTILRGIATAIVMKYESWLHSSGFNREVQNTIEDLPFDEANVFSKKKTQKTDKSLYSLTPKQPSTPWAFIPQLQRRNTTNR